MYIESVSLRNFLSYGDRPVTYDLTKYNTTLITASNGQGKCVDRSTKINVEFLDEETKLKYLKFLDK